MRELEKFTSHAERVINKTLDFTCLVYCLQRKICLLYICVMFALTYVYMYVFLSAREKKTIS